MNRSLKTSPGLGGSAFRKGDDRRLFEREHSNEAGPLLRGEQTHERAGRVADEVHLPEATLFDERHQVFDVWREGVVDAVVDGSVRRSEPTAVVDDPKTFGDERLERLPRTEIAAARVDEHHRIATTALSVG